MFNKPAIAILIFVVMFLLLATTTIAQENAPGPVPYSRVDSGSYSSAP